MIMRRTWNAALTGAALLAARGVWWIGHCPTAAVSAEAVDTARQIIALKGGDNIFDPLIPGVIEQSKYMFEQQNPNLGKDLRRGRRQTAQRISRRAMAELNNEVAKVYASRFTEKEIKDLLAFYQIAARPKLIAEEPKALDAEHDLCAGLGAQIVRRSHRQDARGDEETWPRPLARRRLARRMADYDVDLFVIGAGSGGVRAARIASSHGARVMVRGGISRRRHLRDPRLRAEEAAGLCLALCRRIRGRRRLRLDRCRADVRLAAS